MRIAFGVLNIAPGTFWAMTLHEWAALCEAHESSFRSATGAMTREELEELKARFPD